MVEKRKEPLQNKFSNAHWKFSTL